MDLLILVSDFMVNSMLKILKGIFVECMECLNQDAKKKKKEKGQILYKVDRDDQIATGTKQLDIIHKSDGFNADLIEAINYNEYQCSKAGFHWYNYRLCCYV